METRRQKNGKKTATNRENKQTNTKVHAAYASRRCRLQAAPKKINARVRYHPRLQNARVRYHPRLQNARVRRRPRLLLRIQSVYAAVPADSQESWATSLTIKKYGEIPLKKWVLKISELRRKCKKSSKKFGHVAKKQ